MILDQSDIQSINKHFDDNVDKYDINDSRIVNWNNKYSQFIRFKILCDIADLKKTSILDVGCGVGDLYNYLQLRFQEFTYEGIDINTKLLRKAEQKYPKAKFSNKPIDEFQSGTFDYVFASGLFGHRLDDYENKYFEIIEKMYNIAQKGIGFNMLKAGVHPENEVFVTFGPKYIVKKLEQKYQNVTVIQDYLPHDFTIHILK